MFDVFGDGAAADVEFGRDLAGRSSGGDGTVLLVEPFAIDGRAANMAGNPMVALL